MSLRPFVTAFVAGYVDNIRNADLTDDSDEGLPPFVIRRPPPERLTANSHALARIGDVPPRLSVVRRRRT